MDVWQGGLVDIGSEGPSKELSNMRGQNGEVLVVALIVVVWLVFIALFLLRWSRQNYSGRPLNYRSIPAQTVAPNITLVVRNDGRSHTRTMATRPLDENVSLLSEIELDDIPEDAATV